MKLLGNIGQLRDSLMGQSNLLAQSQQGCAINTSVANETAYVLIKRKPQVVRNSDL